MRIETRQSVGSSPLVRGARIVVLAMMAGLGIIPARAGSTACEVFDAGLPEDHPRSCGEHE